MSVYSTETLSPRLSSATHSGGTLSTDRRTRSALASAWFPLFNWERVAEDEADRHEKGEALVLRSSSSVHLQGGGVWLYLGRRGGGVGGARRCLRVSVTDTFDRASELPASNGCRSWVLDQREPPARRHTGWTPSAQVQTGRKKISWCTWWEEENDCRRGLI